MIMKDHKKAAVIAFTFFFISILSFTCSDCLGDQGNEGVNAAKAEASDTEEITIYPNPFRPGEYPVMTFEGLPENASIRIYNIVGELVRSEEDIAIGFFEWDGTNDKERKVSGGVYIYLIKDDKGGTKKGKIAVIR